MSASLHPAPLPTASTTPTLTRRFACAVYEGVMLFGVGLLPAALSTWWHQLLGEGAAAQWATQITGFLCFGVYFVWLWSRNGQTLPMQTWRIQLVRADGGRVAWQQASARYLWCWLWVTPGVLVSVLAGWSKWQMLGAVALWAGAYGVAARFLPDRQFLHDRLAGTRLVNAAAATGPAAR